MLTAYTCRMAELLDPHCDALLVGDSLAQAIYGLPSTVPVTMEQMIAHGAAVVRGAQRSLVIIDLPFGTYEASPEQAFHASARLLKETGAAAVKLEAGAELAETVAFLTKRGIPVMAHVGLTPQSVNTLGGYGARGRTPEEHHQIVADAQALADAGAFAVVVEGVAEAVAIAVTQAVQCPVVGIGASAKCDGQVLVVDDMLGMFERTARFVKQFDLLGQRIDGAVAAYADGVRSRAFPGPENIYAPVDKRCE
ncbi:3-methyl-2-oxobutanoate hydroxymethyltransferase [Pseudomonas sp. TE3610]